MLETAKQQHRNPEQKQHHGAPIIEPLSLFLSDAYNKITRLKNVLPSTCLTYREQDYLMMHK